MARRIEITVPTEYSDLVQECLEDPNRGGLGINTEKAGLVVQIPGKSHVIFLLTLPGAQVGSMLENLKKSGIGNAVGHVVISPIDCMKPKFAKPKPKKKQTEEFLPMDEEGNVKEQFETKNQGFGEFQKARLTTEEIYNNILNNASMTVNTWINLIGACLMAGGGISTNSTIFVVAAMLVSPIMGPILGMTFGYRVADWKLFKLGFLNCVKMTITAFFCGVFIGLVLGFAHYTNQWPNAAMIAKNNQLFNLLTSIVVSGAAGSVVGVSVTSGGINSLVGSAISAGLLPPIVNTGMLLTYALTYAPKEQFSSLTEMAQYKFGFYVTHVVIIVSIANLVFYLKEINPRFQASDDQNMSDLPTLQEYNRRIEAQKAAGGPFKGFLVENLLHEGEVAKKNIVEFTQAHPISDIIPAVQAVTQTVTNTVTNRVRGHSVVAHGRKSSMQSDTPPPHLNGTGFRQVDVEEERKDPTPRNGTLNPIIGLPPPPSSKRTNDFFDNDV